MLQVHFKDVLAEPDGVHSFDCIWSSSECCYTFLFTLTYGLPAGLCHICLSLYWGAEYGLLAFLHAWYVTPFLNKVALVLRVPAFCCRLCTRCLLDPWCESASYAFVFLASPGAYERDDAEIGLWQPTSVY